MISNKPTLLDLDLRFTAPDDIETYGDRWYRYDERALLARPAQELIRLENAIGAPLTDVMNGIREDSVFGDTCAAWLALEAAGKAPDVFREFSPAIMLSQWRKHVEEQEDPGKASTPEPASAVDSDSPPIVLTHEVMTGQTSTPPVE